MIYIANIKAPGSPSPGETRGALAGGAQRRVCHISQPFGSGTRSVA
jgi:hypothetical protein